MKASLNDCPGLNHNLPYTSQKLKLSENLSKKLVQNLFSAPTKAPQ